MPYKDPEKRKEQGRKAQQKIRGNTDSGRRKGVITKGPNEEYIRDIASKRKSYLMLRYGITIEQWQEMFDNQNGCCAICGKHQSKMVKTLSVDHDHKTGIVRGLLCHQCNAALGNLCDDIDVLKKALDYLGG